MSPEVFNHYKIGVDDIDVAHWEVISKLNSAKGFADIGQMPLAIAAVTEAIELLIIEINTEEQRMKEMDYPYRHTHEVAHKTILFKLREAHNQVQSGFRYMSVRYILGLWQRTFLDHMDHHDVQWGHFVQRSK